MKRLLISLLFVIGAFAQQTVPNTTLCAPLAKIGNSVCLTATSGTSPNWSLIDQTGLYIDNEYMRVNLTSSQVISGANTYVPVFRADRTSAGTQSAHAIGAIVWVALVGSQSPQYGENGFSYGTQLGDVGACVRSLQAFLPHIWVSKGIKKDCVANPATPGLSQWVNYNDMGDPSVGTVQALNANGALSVTQGNYLITKTSLAAFTLAAPTAGTQDGVIVHISSATAFAHTLTATGLLQTGSASVNTATFAAFAGAGLTLEAYQGKWIVLYSVGVTFS